MDGGLRRDAARALVARCRGADVPPLLVVEGRGGTGKTGVLDAVAAAARQDARPTVRLRGLAFAGSPPPGGLDSLVPGTLVVADDAQWLDDATSSTLVALAGTAGPHGVGLVLAARPAQMRPALAHLFERAARGNGLIRLGPLPEAELAAGLAALLGAPPDRSLLEVVAEASGSSPLWASALVGAWREANLVTRGRLVGEADLELAATSGVLAGRLRQLRPEARITLAALVAGAGPVVAEWLAVRRPDAHAEVVDWGLVSADTRVPPLVATGARLLLDAGERARGEELAAAAGSETGAPPERRAEHLWRARSTAPSTAATYRAAGDRLVRARPALAAEWYRRAILVDPGDAAARLGRVHALLAGDEARGALVEAELLVGDQQLGAAAVAATAAVFAARGLWADAAARLDAAAARLDAIAGADAPLAAVVQRMWWRTQANLCRALAGDVPGAQRATGDDTFADAATTLVGRVTAALVASAGGGPAHVEATRRSLRELAALAPDVSFPADAVVTAEEAAAAVALITGDPLTARRLLAGAPTTGLRSRAVARLAAWVELRLGEPRGANPGASSDGSVSRGPGELVDVAVEAAAARRSGDVAGGMVAARRLSATLAGATVDLTNFDPAAELVVLARRFGLASLGADLERRLEGLLAELGWPPLWTARLFWARLEAAAATRQQNELNAAGAALADLAVALPSLAPLAEAAAVWAQVMDGLPDPERVEGAVAGLRDVGLALEASQLAGQAAIRVDDAGVAKSLLGRARALRGEAGGGRDEGDRPLTRAGLSEREVEVGRLVLDGLTHRDIGATLYISSKTVEHHVAHIRTKLGTTNRAAFLASLREDLAAQLD